MFNKGVEKPFVSKNFPTNDNKSIVPAIPANLPNATNLFKS